MFAYDVVVHDHRGGLVGDCDPGRDLAQETAELALERTNSGLTKALDKMLISSKISRINFACDDMERLTRTLPGK